MNIIMTNVEDTTKKVCVIHKNFLSIDRVLPHFDWSLIKVTAVSYAASNRIIGFIFTICRTETLGKFRSDKNGSTAVSFFLKNEMGTLNFPAYQWRDYDTDLTHLEQKLISQAERKLKYNKVSLKNRGLYGIPFRVGKKDYAEQILNEIILNGVILGHYM